MQHKNSFFRRFGLLTSGSSIYMTAALVILMFGFATAVLMTARHFINDDSASAREGVEAVSAGTGADPQSAEAAAKQAADQALIAATPGAVGVNAQGQPVDAGGNVIPPAGGGGAGGGGTGSGGDDPLGGVNGTLDDTIGTVNGTLDDTIGTVNDTVGTVNDTVGDVTDTVNELPLPVEVPPIEVPEVQLPPIQLPQLPGL